MHPEAPSQQYVVANNVFNLFNLIQYCPLMYTQSTAHLPSYRVRPLGSSEQSAERARGRVRAPHGDEQVAQPQPTTMRQANQTSDLRRGATRSGRECSAEQTMDG